MHIYIYILVQGEGGPRMMHEYASFDVFSDDASTYEIDGLFFREVGRREATGDKINR